MCTEEEWRNVQQKKELEDDIINQVLQKCKLLDDLEAQHVERVVDRASTKFARLVRKFVEGLQAPAPVAAKTVIRDVAHKDGHSGRRTLDTYDTFSFAVGCSGSRALVWDGDFCRRVFRHFGRLHGPDHAVQDDRVGFERKRVFHPKLDSQYRHTVERFVGGYSSRRLHRYEKNQQGQQIKCLQLFAEVVRVLLDMQL